MRTRSSLLALAILTLLIVAASSERLQRRTGLNRLPPSIQGIALVVSSVDLLVAGGLLLTPDSMEVIERGKLRHRCGYDCRGLQHLRFPECGYDHSE